MSRERLAAAYDALAEAYAQVAHELRGTEQPVAEGASANPHTRSSAPAAPNTALGVCPTHRVAWTVKQGGISKNGKPYRPFWRCNEKDANGYCSEKPSKAWADSHPIQTEAVDEEPPF